MQRELLITGIGGQGVQLAGQVLARAAIEESLHVQLFGSYGGMMRGGRTDVTMVFDDGPIEAPPTLTTASSGIVMHPEYAAPTVSRVTDVVLVNTTVCGTEVETAASVVGVPATDLAIEAGNVMAASMVMVGAYAAVTELVTRDALARAVIASLPAYRAQHIELNGRALDAGFGFVGAGAR